MPLNDTLIYSSALDRAIDPSPLIVAPETPLVDVLALMSQVRSSCPLPVASSSLNATILSEIRASCVLVMAGMPAGMHCQVPGAQVMGNVPILGIFTERDIVRLTAARMDLNSVCVADVMTKPVITLTQSDSQGIFTALSLFRQHRIRHLPIVDQQGQLLGMVTPESIRKALQPANILTRLRSVKDVMNPQVIQASKEASVLDLAKLMAEHRVSCVVIAQEQEKAEKKKKGKKEEESFSTLSPLPLGIVTERDIVQFQALALDLGKMPAQDVMSSPLFCLNPSDSLWLAHQEMQRLHVRRMVVVGNQGELVGIVSQTSLLQALDPKEMYGIIEALQQAVEERTTELQNTNERLQSEVLERVRAEKALQQAHDDLQRQVEERTAELQAANAMLLEDIIERQRVENALRQSETQLRQKADQLTTALQDLQQTQAQLIQAEKMSGLGQLVAGIAHEINNPVNFIYGNLSYAGQYIKDLLHLLKLYRQSYPNLTPEISDQSEKIDLDFLIIDLPKLLDSMKLGAERIRKIVLSLRNFSRLDEAEKKRVDIHEGIDSTLLILHHRLKPKSKIQPVEIIKEYGVLPAVECYAGTLNQVFMNIINNAIDALEEVQSFVPSVGSNERVALNKEQPPTIRIRTGVLDSNWIFIRIADNGIGMPASVRQHLFEPFFTTKPVGKGTGLGLSISYQIVVEKHKGRLECISEVGEGTEFIIEIPILQPKQQKHLLHKFKQNE
ncbi:CBS domain-containing protein [Microcoleus sp. FACHB-68]|uniref:CBS domain-containing protein n=1 Tax=Microcoleus sp. FACHB-68 TaxID=2692826 RepID=UPI001685DE86|nr:CBS domain-containing protein [Microcoleus sp. FACHB-68]MBD1939427.1 CBS domain-containing protein [Microcoleus sp. FACHB-68]